MISPSRILFIRWARLGDVILSEPAVRLCRQLFPLARISYLTGHRCAPVLEMIPAVDEVISLDRIALREGNKLQSIYLIFQFAQQIRQRGFDLVIDLTGFPESQLLALWSGARWRVGLKRYQGTYWVFCFNLPPVEVDKSHLMAELYWQVVKSLEPLSGDGADRLSSSPPEHGIGARADEKNDAVIPHLQLTPLTDAMAQELWRREKLDQLDFVYGFQLSASDLNRLWPLERFIELANRIAAHAQANQRQVGFVNFAPPEESVNCKRVSRAIHEAGHFSLVPTGPPTRALGIPFLAALMKRCSAVISSDTGPMHLSAAVGTPTLGLFSIGTTEHYRPLGLRCSFLKKNPVSLLSVDEVFKEFVRLCG